MTYADDETPTPTWDVTYGVQLTHASDFVMRVTVEADTSEEAQRLADRIVESSGIDVSLVMNYSIEEAS